MSARRSPASISPTAFDITDARGRPLPRRGRLEPELAFDGPVVRKVSTYCVRPDDKELMDALQAWFRVRHGRALTQWELFTIVLAEALSKQGGPFAGALEDLP